ncbi:RNA helicase [Malassezia vespertilionis]|uniref:RNA helicase n=1 Tax=Malassezia vespertilionis TaxID=2020962 RepID=A0A2N1JFS0_9BASI|nr:RNA helicase [Malassezia vespertilionis]PKI85388.1 Drs1p [Malassezia vespertilionis]WFD04998.1 RNA helicase [Malassezia vespertilionis]
MMQKRGRAKHDDFVMTLDSDEEEERVESNLKRAEPSSKGKKAKARISEREKIVDDGRSAANAHSANATENLEMGQAFEFDVADEYSALPTAQDWNFHATGASGANHADASGTAVDEIIARHREAGKIPVEMLSTEEEDALASDLESEESGGEEFGGAARNNVEDDEGEEEEEDPLQEPKDEEAEEEEEEEEEEAFADDDDMSDDDETRERKDAYFAQDAKEEPSEPKVSFASFRLNRNLQRAIASLGFEKPTPIQARTIPLALAGKDSVASAVTGSGKTAAFLIPILERLSYRAKGAEASKSRVLILCPTRELAIQCASVGKALAKYTGIRFCLCVGGLSLKTQETELKTRPDVIVATPGRLIDHMRNSASFGLDDIEILVIDEADRMLEDGFEAELNEIVQACPTKRQTMLFSATMTDNVDQLVRLSLDRPVRLFVDPKKSTNANLVQEFVRVRAPSGADRAVEEEQRAAMLLTLCMRTFRNQVIIFVRSKKLAHQLKILFGLLGLSASELHGDLSQEQRMQSLVHFRDGKVDFLLATDLASRGIDIRGVQAVINYDMPAQLEQYLHRVGRTARAGRQGRSVTLVGEGDRRLLKAVLKRTQLEQVKHRLLPPDMVQKLANTVVSLKPEMDAILEEEKEERALRQAEMELRKGENMIAHKDEIYSRPARTWFQSEKEKAASKDIARAEYIAKVDTGKRKQEKDRFAGLSRRKKRNKLMREEDAKEDNREILASIRSAKRAQRPKELGVYEPNVKKQSKATKKRKPTKATQAAAKKSGTFSRDMSGSRGKRR